MEPQPSAPAAEVKQPVVFQCATCLSIVGDSLAWVQADESVGTITLSAMRGVKPQLENSRTSTAGKDKNCVYAPVVCKGTMPAVGKEKAKECGAELGKMYTATSEPFDAVRDRFTIKTASLRGYELGKYDTESVQVNSATGEAPPSIDALQEKIWRMEQLLLLFNERFERIETLIGPAPAADATAADKSEGRDDQRRKLARK